MNQKIAWLRNKLKGINLDGMIVSNPINIKYLTNITAEGILLITRKENIYITDARYIEIVNSTLTIDDEIIVYDERAIRPEDYENFFLFCENVGFEENNMTYASYKKMMHMYKIESLQETENLIEAHRTIKDQTEIEKFFKLNGAEDISFEPIVASRIKFVYASCSSN